MYNIRKRKAEYFHSAPSSDGTIVPVSSAPYGSRPRPEPSEYNIPEPVNGMYPDSRERIFTSQYGMTKQQGLKTFAGLTARERSFGIGYRSVEDLIDDVRNRPQGRFEPDLMYKDHLKRLPVNREKFLNLVKNDPAMLAWYNNFALQPDTQQIPAMKTPVYIPGSTVKKTWRPIEQSQKQQPVTGVDTSPNRNYEWLMKIGTAVAGGALLASADTNVEGEEDVTAQDKYISIEKGATELPITGTPGAKLVLNGPVTITEEKSLYDDLQHGFYSKKSKQSLIRGMGDTSAQDETIIKNIKHRKGSTEWGL